MDIFQKIFRCALVIHAHEYRISKNPAFKNYPEYAVCLDCGSAERTTGVLLSEATQRIGKRELQELEKFGYDVDVKGTIALAGIKRHHLKRYPKELVEKYIIPLREYLNIFKSSSESLG